MKFDNRSCLRKRNDDVREPGGATVVARRGVTGVIRYSACVHNAGETAVKAKLLGMKPLFAVRLKAWK